MKKRKLPGHNLLEKYNQLKHRSRVHLPKKKGEAASEIWKGQVAIQNSSCIFKLTNDRTNHNSHPLRKSTCRFFTTSPQSHKCWKTGSIGLIMILRGIKTSVHWAWAVHGTVECPGHRQSFTGKQKLEWLKDQNHTISFRHKVKLIYPGCIEIQRDGASGCTGDTEGWGIYCSHETQSAVGVGGLCGYLRIDRNTTWPESNQNCLSRWQANRMATCRYENSEL